MPEAAWTVAYLVSPLILDVFVRGLASRSLTPEAGHRLVALICGAAAVFVLGWNLAVLNAAQSLIRSGLFAKGTTTFDDWDFADWLPFWLALVALLAYNGISLSPIRRTR